MTRTCNKSATDIDALLPQTQCGLCGYGGCMPYAEALVHEDAPINLCPPGGMATLNALGEALAVDASPYLSEMKIQAKPRAVAKIIEDICIGCTKCIAVCPVDAIVGAQKLMHTVLTAECTGCELCVPVCPMDCIDINQYEPAITPELSQQFRNRHQARDQRLAKEAIAKTKGMDVKKQSQLNKYVEAAIKRVHLKKGKSI